MPTTQPLKFLAMPCDVAGGGWYRIRQPFQMIRDHTIHDAHVWDKSDDDTVAIADAARVADVAVVRQGGEGAIRFFRSIPDFRHLKWVLDVEDNMELISPYSSHYAEYGTEEFYDRNLGQWLWKAGVSGFDPKANRARRKRLLQGMREADLVTVTTPALADYARHYNPHVAVLPNLIDPAKWWKLDFRPHDRLRIGWSGGVSHYEDWHTIREPLNALMREFPFTLVIVGSEYPGLIDPANRDLVEVWPWVPFEAHSYRMMCLGLDIALIPLVDLPFNRFKSAVKWYEMSAMCVPSVVSNVTPYKEEIGQGNALSYRTPEEFYEAVKFLIKNPLARSEVGHAADQWVTEHRNAKTSAGLWSDTYSSLLT